LTSLFGSPAILGSFGGVFHDVSEEARTRGIASLTFVRFAFIGVTERLMLNGKPRQFWNVLEREQKNRLGSFSTGLVRIVLERANRQLRVDFSRSGMDHISGG